MPHEAPTVTTAAFASNEIATPHVVVRFPVQGRTLPADHAYALYGAVSRVLPALHEARWLAIEMIDGVPWGQGVVALPNRGASFRLRLPADRFGAVLSLAGRRFDIGGHPIMLGIPSAHPLAPAPSLYARCVTIKNFTEPASFLEAAGRQLDRLGITARLELPTDEQGRSRRRVLKIKHATIVGFSVAAHDLSDYASLLLQTHGIGGRRAMGCGIFNPIISNSLKQ